MDTFEYEVSLRTTDFPHTDHLNSMGAEGWELVAIEGAYYIWKRCSGTVDVMTG